MKKVMIGVGVVLMAAMLTVIGIMFWPMEYENEGYIQSCKDLHNSLVDLQKYHTDEIVDDKDCPYCHPWLWRWNRRVGHMSDANTGRVE